MKQASAEEIEQVMADLLYKVGRDTSMSLKEAATKFALEYGAHWAGNRYYALPKAATIESAIAEYRKTLTGLEKHVAAIIQDCINNFKEENRAIGSRQINLDDLLASKFAAPFPKPKVKQSLVCDEYVLMFENPEHHDAWCDHICNMNHRHLTVFWTHFLQDETDGNKVYVTYLSLDYDALKRYGYV